MFKETNNDYQSSEKSSSKLFFRRRKGCPMCAKGAKKSDYKDPDGLVDFISEGGRMLPSRITNVCAMHQRKLKGAIRLSRILALLPYVFKIK